MNHYILYGAEVSLYTGKARAYLRYKGIPFEERQSTRKVYREIIVPRVGRPIIPVVITPEDETLQDTTVILDALEERFPEPSIYPDTPAQKLVALLVELYGDEWLVMPAMHYRWHFRRNLPFILKEFGGVVEPRLPGPLKTLAGIAPALAFGNLYRPYFGINRRTRKAVEKSYLGFLDEFNEHLKHHDYLLGGRPSIGDYGLIAPLYAHLYRDPVPGKLMRKRAPHVARWVERVENGEPASGDWLADDAIPETLMPILARLLREQAPVLIDTISAVDDWAAAHPDKTRLPRVIGKHAYELEGVRGERMIQPFAQWMAQRPVLFYQSLTQEQKRELAPILRLPRARELLEADIGCRLAYRKHRVVVDQRAD